MEFVTRRAYKRLAVLGLLIIICLGYGYIAMIRIPLKSFGGPLPAITPTQKEMAVKLRKHVVALGQEIGERNTFVPKKLSAAADYVERALSGTGRRVERQEYMVIGEKCANLEIEIPGRSR